MDTNKILSDLRAERDRIDHAIAAIESLTSNGNQVVRRGRTAPSAAAPSIAAKPATKQGGRRRISAAGRRRISEAAKKRWAAQRLKAAPVAKKAAAAKKTTAVKKAAPARRGMSAAARKRMSEMMKKRWAERKGGAKAAKTE